MMDIIGEKVVFGLFQMLIVINYIEKKKVDGVCNFVVY